MLGLNVTSWQPCHLGYCDVLLQQDIVGEGTSIRAMDVSRRQTHNGAASCSSLENTRICNVLVCASLSAQHTLDNKTMTQSMHTTSLKVYPTVIGPRICYLASFMDPDEVCMTIRAVTADYSEEYVTLLAAQHSTAQHSTAQRSTAQCSAAQHSAVQYSTAQPYLGFIFSWPCAAVDGDSQVF